MAYGRSEALPEIAAGDFTPFKKLPSLFSQFSVPYLEDRPQNPIIQRLQTRHTSLSSGLLPKELLVLSEDLVAHYAAHELKRDVEFERDIWGEAADAGRFKEGRIASWDTLRLSSGKNFASSGPSPFLSEQTPNIVAAARFHARPTLLNPSTVTHRLSSEELIENLSSTLLGCSTAIHVWDTHSERFATQRPPGLETVHIQLGGMDEVVSESYIQRFLIIGTLFRRLDSIILFLRHSEKNSSRKDASIYALAHSLSAVLVHLQNEVKDGLHDFVKDSNNTPLKRSLSAFWLRFEGVQITLEAIAELCGRDYLCEAIAYGSLPLQSSVALLSHIYEHLKHSLHENGGCSGPGTDMLAFILSTTSKPYLNDIAKDIGVGGAADSITASKSRRGAIDPLNSLSGENVGEEEDSFEDFESDHGEQETSDHAFPAFFSPDIREAIVRARRSIRILQLAESEPVFTRTMANVHRTPLAWVWSSEKLRPTSNDGTFERVDHDSDTTHHDGVRNTGFSHDLEDKAPPKTRSYPPEIAESFYKFDLEPGSHKSSSPSSSFEETTDIKAFLSNYPSSLPSITPTLPLLAERAFSPIIYQANTLSHASLQLFFGNERNGGSQLLHFRMHVVLLRSYLLITSNSFREKLERALFSDSDADADEILDVRARARTRTYSTSNKSVVSGGKDGFTSPGSGRLWAIGLSPSLTVSNSSNGKQQWPPGGSDLSFYLRRVIMDSLDVVKASEFRSFNVAVEEYGKSLALRDTGEDMREESPFWDEAESRLGFAIRDLPVGTDSGRDSWLNPNSIEALDFLFMDYKPPRPLRALISREILSKYQRVFTFLLQLTRVENALRVVFRLMRKNQQPIFSSDSAANTLLRHFCFVGQSFLSALSSYVFSTAIGGNVDAFLAQVAAAEMQAAMPSDGVESATKLTQPVIFADVHALSVAHSRTMNDVLSACLLRSSQRSYGDVLKGCLEVLLELAVLVGELKRGRIEQIEAAQRMRQAWERWKGKAAVLAKALNKLLGRGATPKYATAAATHALSTAEGAPGEKTLPVAPGGVEALADLLIRLDFNDWWRNVPLTR